MTRAEYRYSTGRITPGRSVVEAAKASPIPAGLRVSRDKRVNPITGEIHYTIRPAYDMPLAPFVQLLTAFSALAVPDFAIPQRKA
jgi:hypothetical protein